MHKVAGFLLCDLVVVLNYEGEMHGAMKRLCTPLVSSIVHRIFGYGEKHLQRF